MKKVIKVIFIFISIISYSQEKLNGKYCTFPPAEGDVICLTFKENNKFDYSVTGCLGLSHVGSGNYELKDKALMLNFDKNDGPKRNKVTISQLESKSPTSVEFEFFAKNENGSPLVLDIFESESDKKYELDNQNNTIQVEKSDSFVNYKIFAIGYETEKLELKQNSSKKIEITMFEAGPVVISEKVYNWNLAELTEKGFKTGTETFEKLKE